MSVKRSRIDHRSPEAKLYRRWYFTREWRNIRDAQLKAEPNCRLCAQMGKHTPATVCDHVTRHNGNEAAFWAGPFQSLCTACHDGAKQRMERRGFDSATDESGYPTDPRHPFNTGKVP